MVQVLIVVDFLLSLSAKAKEKLAKSLPDNPNKSVLYADQTLNEDDVSFSSLLPCAPFTFSDSSSSHQSIHF